MKSFLEILQEEESSGKHHVMTFGRMNPPTTGHLKLIDKVKEIAHKHNAEHSVVTSHSQDSKKNPLSGEQKVKHLKKYSPGTHFVSSSKEHPTFLHHAAELHKKGVTHLHMVAGSDRVDEYKKKLNQYNGTHKGALYNFKKIHVHSAGHRDPDAEGTSGMSGSKMRDAASEKRFHDVKNHKGQVVKPGFRSGVPAHVSDKHAKELMHDTRKGMGLHEDVNRGMFRAIFVTGGPGSGKDVIIREAIAESKIVELNFVQAKEYLADKQKLSEQSKDFRREGIRNRGPLIINGPADDKERIAYIKEELEELGYQTMMVFVNTTDEVSKERNSLLSRMMVESVRQDKWSKSQRNTKYFTEAFKNFVVFDNTGSIDEKEEDIHQIYESTTDFLDSEVLNETSKDWLNRNNKLNINSLFKEDKNVKSNNRFLQKTRNISINARGPGDQSPDNSASYPADNVKDGSSTKRPNKTYTFGQNAGVYAEATLKKFSEPKETNFSKDKEKVKRNKMVPDPKTGEPSGVGSEWNTRTNGSGLTGGAGLGNQTYSECMCQDYSNENPASTAMPSGGIVNPLNTDFKKFRKNLRKEAIDDPGSCEMGVSGTAGSAMNKEPMVTPNDNKIRATDVIKKRKTTENKNVWKK
jgi:cytidyltransferase-like protein